MTPVRRDEPRKPVIARGSPLPQLGDRCTNIVPIERGARRIDAVYISAACVYEQFLVWYATVARKGGNHEPNG